MAEGPTTISIPSTWIGAEDLPVHFANAFVGVVAPNEIFLNIGSYLPPVIVGTPDEREEQLRAITFVPVKPVARIGLTPARLDELIKTLEDTRNNYENLMKAIQTEGADS